MSYMTKLLRYVENAPKHLTFSLSFVSMIRKRHGTLVFFLCVNVLKFLKICLKRTLPTILLNRHVVGTEEKPVI